MYSDQNQKPVGLKADGLFHFGVVRIFDNPPSLNKHSFDLRYRGAAHHNGESKMRRVHTKPRKPSANRETSRKSERNEAGPSVPRARSRREKESLPRSSPRARPRASRPPAFPAQSRRETLADAILKATAEQKYKSSSVLALLGDPSKIQHHHFHALHDAFKSAFVQANDAQALRIAAVLLSLVPSGKVDSQRHALWCGELMETVKKGLPNRGFSQQALLLGKLSHLASACRLRDLAKELSQDIPTYVELAIEQAAQAGSDSLNHTLALLPDTSFNIKAGLMKALRSSIERNNAAVALLLADKCLERLAGTAELAAFQRAFAAHAAACPRQLNIELLEGASSLATQQGLSSLAESFRQEAQRKSQEQWDHMAVKLDFVIPQAVQIRKLDHVYLLLDALKGGNAAATLERQFRAVGGALQRCLQNADDWEGAAQEAEVILTVLTDLLSRFPAEANMGVQLYPLLEEGTRHWTYIERAELQSVVIDIASRRGINADGVLPELARIERAVETSDTALFEELDAIPDQSEQPAAFTGFHLLMHGLQRSLDRPGVFHEERVNRILVAMDDRTKALAESDYEVEPLYQALYQLLDKLTRDWPAQHRQRLQAMAEAAFAS